MINLKEVKYLYMENCKPVIKEMKEYANGKRTHVNGLEDLLLLERPSVHHCSK